MSAELEAIQQRVGKQPGDIDATPIFMGLYGPASIVCHMVRQIDDKTFDAYFMVGQNICGPSARPPMFDRLQRSGESFITQTVEEDAKEHLMGVVPGHNLIGLVAESKARELNEGLDHPEQYMMTGYKFVSFGERVLPNQELKIAGSPITVVSGESGRKARIRELGLTQIELTEDQIQRILAQHWLPEVAAQGLGVTKAQLLKEGMIPIYVGTGQATYEPVPILAGQMTRTRLTVYDTEANQASGKGETFVDDKLIAVQDELLLAFYPYEQIFDKIQS